VAQIAAGEYGVPTEPRRLALLVSRFDLEAALALSRVAPVVPTNLLPRREDL
jgi:hypothetical protein